MSKILYIDTKVLKPKTEIQRDVDFAELLNNHSVYSFKDNKSLMKKGYLPVDMCYSIRTIYSNLVVESETQGRKLYYTNLVDLPEVIHKGDDLVMYFGSLAIFHNMNQKLGFDELMSKYSAFQPIGLYYDSLLNPIFYSNIIMADESVESLKTFLKSDRKLVLIQSIDTKDCIKALTDTLIILKRKEEEK